MKKLKKIAYFAIALLVLLLAGYIYSLFFKPLANESGNSVVLILMGIILGGIIVFLIFRLISKTERIQEVSSHTVVESMRKVFKIVFAEGQFQEILNYKDSRKLLKFIPATKRALVIIRAKVLVGYDFEKCRWELDEENKTMKIIYFPEPEILSIEPDYNYYQIEEDLFSVFNRFDLEKIQKEGKQQIENAALQSGLKQIAAEQMRTVLTEVLAANQWKITNPEMLALTQHSAKKDEQ